MRWLVVLLVACGVARDPNPYRNPKLGDYAANLASASQRRDVAGVRRMLREETTVGGLSFPDTACTKRFAFPGHVSGPLLDELARCLTTLQLSASERADALPDVMVLTSAPGIELEARFVETEDGPWVAWIGYVARRDVRDAIPTITAATLESLRVTGDRNAPLAGPGAFDELPVLKHAYAWMKICINAEGTVTGSHVREASSPHAARVFAAAIETWQFKPFLVGTQPTPACSMVRMVCPSDGAGAPEVLPLPVPDGPDEVVNVPTTMLGTRTRGNILVTPDDEDKVRLQKAHLLKLIAALHYCLDETGRVDRVTLIRSSGLPRYDDKIVAAARTWVFKPFLDEGKAIRVCSSTHFIYTQGRR
jgi:TonB family protein